jgi:hypothetical protein
MSKLTELYDRRSIFESYGSPVPDALAKEIADEELKVLESELMPMLEDTVAPSINIDVVTGKLFVALEYTDSKLTRIGLSRDETIFDSLTITKNIVDDSDAEEVDDDDDSDSDDDDNERTRSKSIPFTVKFADGKTIYFKNAQKTMIEALRYMSLERASQFKDENFKGFPLVGTKQRITENKHKWQRYVDGWWVYINMGNPRKIRCLKGVAKLLNIDLEISPEGDMPVLLPRQEKHKGKRAKFSLNGGTPDWKNRSVLNAVRLFTKELPSATYEEITQSFPKSLQGSYGVVITLEEFEKRRNRNQTEDQRWFIEPEDILTSADGIKFVVSNEWGDNFAFFQSHINKEFGWTLKEE